MLGYSFQSFAFSPVRLSSPVYPSISLRSELQVFSGTPLNHFSYKLQRPFTVMAPMAVIVILLAMTSHSCATWCICKDGMGDSVLQKTLDYACGAGANCNPIKQNGPCFQPNTVKAHCNYAVNSYFQRKGQSQGSCDFAGTATISPSDPSTTCCMYPSSASGRGTSTTPSTTMPNTGPPTTGTSTNMPSTTTPYSGTPSTGILGGIDNGAGPSGPGIITDDDNSGFRLVHTLTLSYISGLILSAFVILVSMRA